MGHGAEELEVAVHVRPVVEARPQEQAAQAVAADVERHQRLDPFGQPVGRVVDGHGHRLGPDRQVVGERGPGDGRGIVRTREGTDVPGLEPTIVTRPVERGPPGEEQLAGEIDDLRLRLRRCPDHAQRPGDLVEGPEPELERVDLGRGPLEQRQVAGEPLELELERGGQGRRNVAGDDQAAPDLVRAERQLPVGSSGGSPDVSVPAGPTNSTDTAWPSRSDSAEPQRSTRVVGLSSTPYSGRTARRSFRGSLLAAELG